MHLSKPSGLQREIAQKLGVSLRGASQSIAAARIYDAVEGAIAPESSPRRPTEKQVKFAKDLGVYRIRDSFRVCAARIDEELRRRNAAAMKSGRLKPGDRVEKRYRLELDGDSREIVSQHIVSSISSDLRVYFKNPGDSEHGHHSCRRSTVSSAL